MKQIIQSDDLATIYRDTETGKLSAHGKRVGADHPFTVAERRSYVKFCGNTVKMCRTLMDNRAITLAEAWRLVQEARGLTYREMNEHRKTMARRRMPAQSP